MQASLPNEHETMVGTSRPYSKVSEEGINYHIPFKVPLETAIILFLTIIINIKFSSTDPSYC